MRKFLILLLLMIPSLAFAAPHLFFSDLTDAQNHGWEQSPTKGAAVSLWGTGFGSTRGSSYVTVGGVNLTSDADYAEWSATENPHIARGMQRITFWLNSSIPTGTTTISVHVGEETSETISFYVRDSGNIYFVARDGDDSNDGLTTGTPWKTMGKAREVADAGDTIYFRAGTYDEIDTIYPDPDDPNYNWDDCVLALRNIDSTSLNHRNGTENNCIAFVGYPGEVAQLGDGTDTNDGEGHPLKPHIGFFFHTSGILNPVEYWTFSKFKIDVWTYGTEYENTGNVVYKYLRFIGFDGTTRHAEIGHGIFFRFASNGDHIYVYGNYIHHVGKLNEDDPHGYKTGPIYVQGFGYQTNFDFGWNEFAHNNGTSQFYGHTSTDYFENIRYHDNFIIDSGTTGAVTGGGDGSEDYTCMRSAYFYNNIFCECYEAAMKIGDGSPGSHGGIIYVYNNLFYHNDVDSSTVEIFTTGYFDEVHFTNNIICSENSLAYFSSAINSDNWSGSHNIFFGHGDGPDWLNGNINSEPVFVESGPQTIEGFFPADGSNMIDAGTNVSSLVPKDIIGVHRPVGSAFDVGPYEGNSSASGSPLGGNSHLTNIGTGASKVTFK